jgi:hypothetical protein
VLEDLDGDYGVKRAGAQGEARGGCTDAIDPASVAEHAQSDIDADDAGSRERELAREPALAATQVEDRESSERPERAAESGEANVVAGDAGLEAAFER